VYYVDILDWYSLNLNLLTYRAAIALHVAGLKHTQQKLQERISNYVPGAKDVRGKLIDIQAVKLQLDKTDQALATGMMMMDILERREPVEQLRVLGIPCEMPVAIGILSSLGVVLTALSQLVFAYNVG
jgi:hypothetical protein